MKRMFENDTNMYSIIMDEISASSDPNNPERGMVGFKRYNLYHYNLSDASKIYACIDNHADIYRKCYNTSDLVQSVLSDLLDEGLIFAE